MMTPARRKREMDKADEEQRRVDEEKYVGFSVACNNDDAHGCQSLAEWYALLRGDYHKAAAIYKTNCSERRYGNSCFNLGILYGAGRGVEKDQVRSMELFEEGCTLGNGDACDLAGRSLLERAASALAAPSEPEASAVASSAATTTPSASAIAESAKLRSRGLKMLDHGCTDLENSSSCNFLGEAYLVGRFGVEVDKKRAAPLLELACERFEMTACRNLMVMYSRGDGVPRDFAKAEQFREQSIAAVQQQSGVSMPDFLQERYQKKMQEDQASKAARR